MERVFSIEEAAVEGGPAGGEEGQGVSAVIIGYRELGRRRIRAPWFRTMWNPTDYACRDDSGSLKPVPPGTTRKVLYCSHCRAERCLFASSWQDEEPEVAETEKRVWAPSRAAAQMRKKGLCANGRPLARTCYNCIHLRIKWAGYVCVFEPEVAPLARTTMAKRKAEKLRCQEFGLRTEVDIPFLDEDEA